MTAIFSRPQCVQLTSFHKISHISQTYKCRVKDKKNGHISSTEKIFMNDLYFARFTSEMYFKWVRFILLSHELAQWGLNKLVCWAISIQISLIFVTKDPTDKQPSLGQYWSILLAHICVIRPRWRHQMETFPRYWPFLWGIHRWPVDSPHKGQWRGALMLSLICSLNKRLSKQSWGWCLRRHRAHYDVIVMPQSFCYIDQCIEVGLVCWSIYESFNLHVFKRKLKITRNWFDENDMKANISNIWSFQIPLVLLAMYKFLCMTLYRFFLFTPLSFVSLLEGHSGSTPRYLSVEKNAVSCNP